MLSENLVEFELMSSKDEGEDGRDNLARKVREEPGERRRNFVMRVVMKLKNGV